MKIVKKYLFVSLLLSFSSFSFASNFSVWDLFGEHIAIGLSQKNVVNSPFQQVSNILEMQEEIKNQISYNILRDLDIATTNIARSVVITNYLSHSRQLLQLSQSFLDKEEQLIREYSQMIKDCEKPIEQYNVDFSREVRNFNYTLAQKISTQIASLRVCIAENTVFYRERLLYRDTLVSLKASLEKRVSYLEANQDKIANYYGMLKPQLLKELYDVSQTLQVNFFS